MSEDTDVKDDNGPRDVPGQQAGIVDDGFLLTSAFELMMLLHARIQDVTEPTLRTWAGVLPYNALFGALRAVQTEMLLDTHCELKDCPESREQADREFLQTLSDRLAVYRLRQDTARARNGPGMNEGTA